MARGVYTGHLTRAGLNLIQQALSIYDGDLRLAVSNRPFQTMFGLPQHLVTPGAGFEETIEYLVATGEYGEVDDPETFIRDRVEAARAVVPTIWNAAAQMGARSRSRAPRYPAAAGSRSIPTSPPLNGRKNSCAAGLRC